MPIELAFRRYLLLSTFKMLGYRPTIYDFLQNLHLRLKRTPLVRLGPTPVAMQVTVLFNFLIVQSTLWRLQLLP